ncbi:sugar ABC transporter permease, partial [Bacillus spizizenii]|nr:sugar ABC transporter permease [Bacillus spizizenii]
METVPKKGDSPVLTAGKGTSWMAAFKRDKWLYLLLIPGLLYFLIFKYLPMWGVL